MRTAIACGARRRGRRSPARQPCDGAAEDAGDRAGERSSRRRRSSGAAGALPAPARPAFRVGRPRLLERGAAPARFAPVSRRVPALAAPRAGAAPVAHARDADRRRHDERRAGARGGDEAGALWVHVRLPVLPNGRHRLGAAQTRSAATRSSRTRLVVDRARLTATLFKRGRPIFQAPVGVGHSGGARRPPASSTCDSSSRASMTRSTAPSRSGRTRARRADGLARRRATSASTARTPQSSSRAASRTAACGMRNEDILALSRLMPVGTPLTIR